MNKIAQALEAEKARKETADSFLRIEHKIDELTDQIAELAEAIGKLLPVEGNAGEAQPAKAKRAKAP
jgi:hypothetical protein